MRHWLRFRQDLGFQLLALYLLLIVPFLITLASFDRIVGEQIRRDVESNDLALARAIALEADVSIGNALKTVVGLSEYPEVSEMDIGGMEPVFKVTLDARPDVNLVYRLDENGIMVFHYPIGPVSTVGTDFSFRQYFQDALISDVPLISEGRISPTTDQAVATAVMPIRSSQGAFLGLVGTNIKLESMSETLSAIYEEYAQDEGFDVLILDASGQVIAHPNPEFLLKKAGEILPDVYTAVLNDRSGSVVVDDLDGVERLYTFETIPTIGWGVIVSRPTGEAFSTQTLLHRVVLIIAGTFVLIGLFFWRTLTVRVIQPIEQLAPISEAIGLNKPISDENQSRLQVQSGRDDQIGHLIRSILQMKNSIAGRMREQSTLLETSTAVVSSLDPETVLNQILEQMGRLLQIKMYAIIALDEQNGSFRIRASRGLSQQFSAQLSIQPSEPDSVTMRALQKKEPIQVSDTEMDPSYAPRKHHARAEGFRAILAVPLNTQYAPPTALLVFHPTPHIFSQNEIQLLTSFANHAAMAIENALLYERSDMRLREQTNRLEALIQSMHDGLILSDLNGRVIYANKRLGTLADISTHDLTGLHTEEILARIADKAAEKPGKKKQVLSLLQYKDEKKIEISQNYPKGILYLRLEVFNVNDEDGNPVGRGIIFQDITADRELDRIRSSLVSTVSHELRTPLAAIKGYASTLLADDVEWDRDSEREFLTIISDESDRLTNLVNNLLDLSRLEAGSLKLTWEKCDIEEIIQNSARNAQLFPSMNVEVGIEAKLPAVYADPLRLESILRNLIENSIKYAGEDAKINIGVTRNGGNILFRVSDNGPGIPHDENDRIFERFYRVDDSLTRLSSGAGLGLAICQGLVWAHGGRIWVEPVERGTCIAFTIPIAAKPHPTHGIGAKRKAI